MTLYCTVDNVKQFAGTITFQDMGFETEDQYSEYVDFIIEGASRYLDLYCNKTENFFQNAGVSITEYFNGRGGSPPGYWMLTGERIARWQKGARTFKLEKQPILSITTFQELIGSTWTTRTEGDASDFRHVNGVIYMLRNIPREGWENVKITYKGGFLLSPKAIQLATAMLVANYVQLKTRDRSVSVIQFRRPAALEFADPGVMTPEIKGILMQYKTMQF